jgi:hypothetical protein
MSLSSGGVNGRTLKINLTEIQSEGVDWIPQNWGKNRWLALVYTVMNLTVLYKVGESQCRGATVIVLTLFNDSWPRFRVT